MTAKKHDCSCVYSEIKKRRETLRDTEMERIQRGREGGEKEERGVEMN